MPRKTRPERESGPKPPATKQSPRQSATKATDPYLAEDRGEILQVIGKSFSGPVPPLEILKGYGNILPDMPERILAMAEREQEHSHKKENKVIDYTQRDVRRRQWLSAAVSFFSLATAGFCAWTGASWLIAVGAIFPALTTIFLWLHRRFGEPGNGR